MRQCKAHYLLSDIYYSNKFYEVNYYDPPIEVFKIVYVDPSNIRKFSGRRLPLWKNKKDLLGSVLCGDWDSERKSITTEKFDDRRWLYDLIFTGNYYESVFHKSLENHFEYEVCWKKTEFIQENIDMINKGYKGWKNSESITELLNNCKRLDEIYKDIKENGYKSQAELDHENSIVNKILNEILVDIGSDGNLLLVDNRHRLSIAKILGIDVVPVAFLVRHEQWMEKRDNIYKSDSDMRHPDCVEFQNSGFDSYIYRSWVEDCW